MKCKLNDICSFANEKIDVALLSKTSYISTENMLPNKAGITTATSLPTVNQTQAFKSNDVLISNIRPYFKKIWYATFDGGCSNDVLVLRANADIDPHYLYYLLADDVFFDYATATAKGTKMPRGDKAAIMKFEVNVYDIAVQRKIVSLLADIDAKIALNNDINCNLQNQAQALFKSWFVDFEPFGGEMPNDWHNGTVSEIIELHDAKRIPLSNRERAELAKIYPYYGATSIMDYVDRYLFDGIYLLLGEDGTVVDDKGFPILQYVEGKFWVNNHAHIITGKNGFSVEMLYLLFRLTNVQSIVTGAVQPKISQANLKSISTIIPSGEILKQFDTIVQPFFAQIRNIKAENDRLIALRDTLLPKLMNGEIDVSEVEI